MGIGFSIFLLALGAILTFAVHATIAGVDIQVIGWVLMGAGVLGLVLDLAVFAPRRRPVVIDRSGVTSHRPDDVTDRAVPQTVIERETRDDIR
jgi:hypothetical protein